MATTMTCSYRQPWHYHPGLFKRALLTLLECVANLVDNVWRYVTGYALGPGRPCFPGIFDPAVNMTVKYCLWAEEQEKKAHKRWIRAAMSGNDDKQQSTDTALTQARTFRRSLEKTAGMIKLACAESDFYSGVSAMFKLTPSPQLTHFQTYLLYIFEPAWAPTKPDATTLVQATDGLGRSPLHYAACYKHADACRDLLIAGADPNLQDVYGNTALHYLGIAAPTETEAQADDVQDILRMLLDFGADLDVTNRQGLTLRQIAPRSPHFQSERKRNRLQREACRAMKAVRQSQASDPAPAARRL